MKLAVIFPGVGYHGDKPLLYYARKIANELGYEVITLTYEGFPENLRGDREKMELALRLAMEQTEHQLSEVDWELYESIAFIGKSVGTVTAGAYASSHGLKPQMVLFTPVEATFSFLWDSCGEVFHGTADPWVETAIVERECADKKLPLHILKGTNHSLEYPGDTIANLSCLLEVIRLTGVYLSKL